MKLRFGIVSALVLMAGAAGAAAAATPPRLVVVLVIDQFRPEYIARASAWLLPPRQGDRLGGFRLLTDEGTAYWNAAFSSLATFTCPGHATVLSGADPALTGVIANTWFDREAGRRVGCVDDLQSSDPRIKRSPRALLVTSLGDELKFSNQGRSRVVGMAFKDYAAMVMVGRRADLALWFDGKTGQWVSNPYYTGEQGPPEWVVRLNAEKLPDRHVGQSWEPLLPPEAYADTDRTPVFAGVVDAEAGVETTDGPYKMGWNFPHRLAAQQPPDRDFYSGFQASGFANDFVVESAKRAIEGAGLGDDDAPDILALSFSANDKAGHYFGPDSPEILDLTARTDRALSDLFNYLEGRIGLENVVVALTADHGVQNIPEELLAAKSVAGRVPGERLKEAVEAALDEEFGEADWVAHVGDLDLYLDASAIRESGFESFEVEAVAAKALEKTAGVHRAATRTDILSGRLPDTDWAARLYRNFHPRRSGDVVMVFEPNYFRSETVPTTHGTHYPANSRVPLLLFGPGRIAKANSYRPVDPKDLAPTLSQILGVAYPSGCSGNPLEEALTVFAPGDPSR